MKRQKSRTQASGKSNVRQQRNRFSNRVKGYVVQTEPANVSAAAGYLQVYTRTGREALPVPDVLITVSGCDKDHDGKRDVIAHFTTDSNGTMEPLEVPVAKPEDSPYPYADCSNYILHIYPPDGYYPVNIMNVHVYEGITSSITVNLIPAPATDEDPNTRNYQTPNKWYTDMGDSKGGECNA